MNNQLINSANPLGGRYKIISKLGAGGFGQTFLAQDLHLPGTPQCVIKQFKPQVTDPECLGRTQEGMAACDQALALKPEYPLYGVKVQLLRKTDTTRYKPY
ncbi:MAG: hypothetical protein F6K55_11570 [Moorea sp. SIO4A3]|nr:hypothetical protein [Moorena sp. SIO4A3]